MSSSIVVPEEETETLDDSRTVAELLDSSRWSLAATLAERVAAWRAQGSPRQPFDLARAAARLERWKTQSAFAKHPGLWEERLTASGIDEDELLYLLGESAEQVRAYIAPAEWLDTIAAAYSQEQPEEKFVWPDIVDRARCPFLPVIEPLVRHFERLLADDARAHAGAPFSPALAHTLTSHLPDHFAPMLNRALLVEMHIR
ncbi:MAG: hypothetical protein QOH21_637, partial [Acidobacteriota bacterium]|nr:hypothetical protein [Acidobacteriota bacterium]